MKKLILLFSLSLFIFSCGDGNSSGEEKELKNLREEVIERYDGGDKKVVGYYDGEGSNEVIVKRVHYYSQNDGGGKEKEENYKNGKLEGKYFEWFENGNRFKVCNYKNGILDGDYKLFHFYDSIYNHVIYKDGRIIKTIK